jgi:hypothetical protein
MLVLWKVTARPAPLHAVRHHLGAHANVMSSQCPTCRERGTIRILTADPEPPQIVPCTRCRGTGHHEPAVSRAPRDTALRLNNRKPETVKEWFDLWKNPNPR